MKKALVVYGGWSGHEPDKVAQVVRKLLKDSIFDVEMSNSLDSFLDARLMKSLDLVVPVWTMGKITADQCAGLLKAVHEGGTGAAGFHGGMGDAFREATEYQFMVGGQWVAHPGGAVRYRVHVVDHADPVTAGIDHFDVESEQYYMHVDPGNHVLATTTFEHNGCTMPVVWKKLYGKGRVFFLSVGHGAKDFEIFEVREILRRGMIWAAEGKKAAAK